MNNFLHNEIKPSSSAFLSVVRPINGKTDIFSKRKKKYPMKNGLISYYEKYVFAIKKKRRKKNN